MTRHLIAEGWTQMLVGLDQALDVISSPQTHCHCSSDPEKAVFQACQPASDSAWHDTFAPKLDPSIIKQLKKQLEQDFLKNYPSEILTPETMPSSRLLSLVHKHVKNRGSWAWIPWKYCLSESKSEEVSNQRAPKLAKLESINLSSLLADEPPSIDISNTGMGTNAIRNILDVRNVAIAMCQGAHHSQRFLSLLSQRVDPESGLRTANVVESQSADRQIWSVMCELVNDRDWTLDDSLHELTYIRRELPSLLQLRPRPAGKGQGVPSSSSFPSKGQSFKGTKSGRGKGKGPGKSGKQSGKVQWVTDIQKDGKWLQLCMRYQSGICQLGDACRFHHGCAFPKTDGTACGGKRSAFDHKSTAH